MELIKVENGIGTLESGTAKLLAEYEDALKVIKTIEEEMKEAIKAEMESKGIIKIEDEVNGIVISYIAPSDKEQFDSKKFRKEHADLYDKYVKMTPTRSSIRVKLNG